MMQYPLKPMLFLRPVFQYDYTDWSSNHIWVHKQPLFLWLMSLSMKLFGVNEIAMRLPSALLGAVMIVMIYQIAEFWTKQKTVAFLASFIYTFSYFQLELTSGRFSLDHNDLIFTCFVTMSFWAFTQYLKHNFDLKWALSIGFFVGCAILNKWLTGFLIFGGWGIYVLFAKNEIPFLKKSVHLLLSAMVACIVFAPWQIYILNAFPKESAWEFEFNRKHIFEVLQGHEGSMFYYFGQLDIVYGGFLIPFLIFGIYAALRKKEIDKTLSIAILAMIFVIYAFFSVLVKTKMPAFVFPVSGPIFILIALGLHHSFQWIKSVFIKEKISERALLNCKICALMFIGFLCLKPFMIAKNRNIENENRNNEIHNTKIYKHLETDVENNYTIMNLKNGGNIEMMFYKNVSAYDLFPKAEILDSLQQKGIKFAAFKSHSSQILPQYIIEDPDILILDEDLK
jgi:4-amino-4-deoxy-L-arabinose transferase